MEPYSRVAGANRCGLKSRAPNLQLRDARITTSFQNQIAHFLANAYSFLICDDAPP
jgi:hypothetical protein